MNQRALGRALSRWGYHVHLADNGAVALALLEQSDFGLVILDCEMPVLDGYETARAIRELEGEHRRTAIVAVTASTSTGARERMSASGIDACVSKLSAEADLEHVLGRLWPVSAVYCCAAPAVRSDAPGGNTSTLDPEARRSAGLVRVFLAQVDQQLLSIEEAARLSDRPALSRAVHKLKGSCLAVGLPKLIRICVELEATPERSHELLLELRVEVTRARDRLRTS